MNRTVPKIIVISVHTVNRFPLNIGRLGERRLGAGERRRGGRKKREGRKVKRGGRNEKRGGRKEKRGGRIQFSLVVSTLPVRASFVRLMKTVSATRPNTIADEHHSGISGFLG